MRIGKGFLSLASLFCSQLILGFGSIITQGSSRLFGLHDKRSLYSQRNTGPPENEKLLVRMEELKQVQFCFVPEPQENTWYAPMVFFKRYKHLSKVYKECSVLRLKEICKGFSEIIKCPKNPLNGEVVISSQGKEASTIFASLNDPTYGGFSEEKFEVFSGCVYELGRRYSLRVRCLHSSKVKKFPLKLVVKVDGRTADFMDHFNHELMIYSRIASSTYGASKVRLHPSIYSIFVRPNRKVISKDLLLMEFIEGPAISSIIMELTNHSNLLNYLKNRVSAIMEESVRIYDSRVPSLSDEQFSLKSKIEFLGGSINGWLNSYTEKTIVFSVNLYRRLLYLLDLFHRGGTSFYPETMEDFSRGKWRKKRSFRIHCDLHQDNILVNISENYRSKRSDMYNLTYQEMMKIDLYEDLKIIDLEDTVELSESDFPVPVDKLIGTHPCPVYLTDAEGFSGRLLNNVILITSTLSQSLTTLQDFFRGNGTNSLLLDNKFVLDWVTGGKPERISQLENHFFRVNDSIFQKLKLNFANWNSYINFITNDEILKPCIYYYHIKYGVGSPPKSNLPCSWLSNIIFSQRACRYLEISHGGPDSLKNEQDDYREVRKELMEVFEHSNLTKCQIDNSEALGLTIENVSLTIEEFLPSILEVNGTGWGEWKELFSSQSLKFTNNGSKEIFTQTQIINSNSKKVSDNNSIPSSNHVSGVNSSSKIPKTSKRYKVYGSKIPFNSLDSPGRSLSPSNGILDWIEATQVLGGNKTEQRIQEVDSNSIESISSELDKYLVDLMGLAALQRIISFCSKFSSDIDCENVSSSKITRDGPIASYLVKIPDLGNSPRSDKKVAFSQFLDPCVFYVSQNNSNTPFSNSNSSRVSGWVCSKHKKTTLQKKFKIVVDGRLFLDANRTFVADNKDNFAFQDILRYFGTDNSTYDNYTSEFNEKAFSIIQKHREDALRFWSLESRVRNLDTILWEDLEVLSQGSDRPTEKQAGSSNSVLPRMFIFHSRTNLEEADIQVHLSDKKIRELEGRFNFLPLSGKRSDLSKQISSIIQTGLLSENVFFMENPSNYRVSNMVTKVTRFPNEIHSLVWVSYQTLILGIVEELLRSHTYQMVLSLRALEFLHEFRSKRDFGVTVKRSASGRPLIEVLANNTSAPIICNFNLKKVAIQTIENGTENSQLGNSINGFTLLNSGGTKFAKTSEFVDEVCEDDPEGRADIQALLNDLVLPSLDPLFTLKRSSIILSKVKYNSSIEVRRSNWFLLRVCSFFSQKLQEILEKFATGTSLGLNHGFLEEDFPVLLKSLLLIISYKDQIVSDPTFFKCAKYNQEKSMFEFSKCSLQDYFSISELISLKLTELFRQQRLLFANSTSLALSQSFISYARTHLQIPSPAEKPPSGGLGSLFKKALNDTEVTILEDNQFSGSRNKTIAFDIKWPIIANISESIEANNMSFTL
ncbi:Protein kinase-like domain containing protein [Cryptosporidium felis]|nr:Protein kinase-like domain containing protein [Cryptosporidium felis]